MPELRLFQAVHHLLHAASLDEKRCSLCHVPFSPSSQKNSVPFTSPDLSLCPSCASLLEPRTSGYCPSCGLPQTMRDAPPSLCGECLCSPPPWEHFRFYGVYANTLKELLLRGKFGADSTLLHLLGKLLAQRCLDLPRPDAIVPMPLHPSRLRERGFNQAQELARPLAELLQVPLRSDLLARCRPTPHQVGLNRQERLNNLKNAFVASPSARGLRLLLIDDTCTTGTTLRQATLALLDTHRGARAVDVAVVARTSQGQDAGPNTQYPDQH